MVTVNDDMSVYVTRGDTLSLIVEAYDGDERYTFQAGDVLRINIFEKKNCEGLILSRDFENTGERDYMEIYLAGEETRIGGVINKPSDYQYEIVLNPETEPQTIIGYDEDGAKIFRLFPEAVDSEEVLNNGD